MLRNFLHVTSYITTFERKTMRKLALRDEILLQIDKAARYIGGEVNAVMKNKEDVDIRFAMAFPDVYEIGMSNLGMMILYDMFNKRDDVWCERLFSPWTDLTGSGKSYETKVDVDPILNREYLDNAIAAYASGQDLKNPLISPLFGNFTGFPPTYIQVGSNELLLSDSLLLKKNLEKYHVPVRLEEYKGMWHVFQMSPFKTAYDAMDQVAEFIFDICR